jgi:hypothetical protein
MKKLLAGLVALTLAAASVGCGSASPPAMAAAAPTVKAGSMARFIVHDGHLYALNRTELLVFELGGGLGAIPKRVGLVPISADAETLFPYGHLLFVGTRQGMLVYDLAESKTAPRLIGQASHVVSCDPVVVENDVAYVTLRSGSACRRGTNALLVFDVRDPTRPQQIAQHPMTSPHGLGVDGSTLFVADAKDGLLVFDVRDPRAPKLMAKAPEVSGYDVIANAGTLLVSADDGLYQYRYGPDGQVEPEPLSRIPVGAPKLQVATEPAR